MDPAFKQGVQTVCEAMHRNRLISQPIGEAKVRCVAAAYLVIRAGLSQVQAAAKMGRNQPQVSHAKRRLEALIKTGFLLPDLPLPVGLSYVTRVIYTEAEVDAGAIAGAGAGAIAIAGAFTHHVDAYVDVVAYASTDADAGVDAYVDADANSEEEEDDGFVVELAPAGSGPGSAARILPELMPLPPLVEAMELGGGSDSGPAGVMAGVPSNVLFAVMAATSEKHSLPVQQSVALPVTKADRTAAKALAKALAKVAKAEAKAAAKAEAKAAAKAAKAAARGEKKPRARKRDREGAQAVKAYNGPSDPTVVKVVSSHERKHARKSVAPRAKPEPIVPEEELIDIFGGPDSPFRPEPARQVFSPQYGAGIEDLD